MAGGRPSGYSQELADLICERLAQGESLRSVCRDEGMPAISSIFKWMREHEAFSKQYALAKQESADAMAEDIMDIADDGTNDWMEKTNADGEIIGWTLNGEHVQRSKLRVDARKWLMAKMKPKKYGDKTEVHNTHSFADMTDDELENRIKALENELKGPTS